jgi:ribosomal protein S18 acetylase RimI-like enzyme
MPEVSLRAMTDAEFGDWFAQSERGYADDLVRAYDHTETDARAMAAAVSTRMLPGGRGTDGHDFFRVLDGDAAVGWLWLGPGDDGALWIYDIVIAPAQRGRGVGTATLAAVEALAHARGLGAVALNVFGHNPRAQALYEAAGYETVTTQMRKRLR